VWVAVVGAICHEGYGSPSGSATDPADDRHRVYERKELRDVVGAGRGEDGRERDAGRVGDEVVFGAVSAAVDRARARFGAPFLA
jgi:hypothetical protein